MQALAATRSGRRYGRRKLKGGGGKGTGTLFLLDPTLEFSWLLQFHSELRLERFVHARVRLQIFLASPTQHA